MFLICTALLAPCLRWRPSLWWPLPQSRMSFETPTNNRFNISPDSVTKLHFLPQLETGRGDHCRWLGKTRGRCKWITNSAICLGNFHWTTQSPSLLFRRPVWRRPFIAVFGSLLRVWGKVTAGFVFISQLLVYVEPGIFTGRRISRRWKLHPRDTVLFVKKIPLNFGQI